MSDMKNMIVLKDLPSNLIEEAFVVLKENKKIHKYQTVENKEKGKESREVKDNKDLTQRSWKETHLNGKTT